MNDVIDMASVIKVDADGGIDKISATNLAQIEKELAKIEAKLGKLRGCTVRIQLRVEYEVVE